MDIFDIFSISFEGGLYATDLFDILIIAVFAYIGILFLKQTRSLAAFVGFGILGLVYVLARVFHLYITVLLLQSFFSIFIIVLVIIFQDELKRSFELITTSGTRRIKNRTTVAFFSTVFAIVQAASSLMRKKHGALIIIPGKEMIERHTRGGNILDGMVTTPLLESIFDPGSPGHDGAVVIDKDRILKFGVHLPLSHNIRQIKERGTRHSAAVGISEKSDALALVVSEERGEISLAKEGKMKTLKDTQELEKYLIQHYKEKFPEKQRGFFKNLFKERALEKASAITIACIAWFFIVFQAEIVQRDFNVPISYVNVSEEKIIKDTVPEIVTVTLSARGQAVLGNLTSEDLRVVISGNELDSGINEIELDKGHVSYPFGVSVVNISPDVVTVTAQKYETYEIPVEANVIKEPEKVFLKEISVSPNKIKILVPEREEPPETVFTEPVDAGEVTREETIETRITLPEKYKVHKDASRTVQVTFIIDNSRNSR